jgi:2-dehydro-3-deoxyphosphogluconate aldolase/(4S)-4-hydroxy-2-oxoglutarate aldolase
LFYHKDIEVSKQVLKACYDGGARLLEFSSEILLMKFSQLYKYAIANRLE